MDLDLNLHYIDMNYAEFGSGKNGNKVLVYINSDLCWDEILVM